MNKMKLFLCTITFCAVGITGYTAYEKTQLDDLLLNDVEAITTCESIGWWDNDGNCVKNDAGTYFCKSDSW